MRPILETLAIVWLCVIGAGVLGAILVIFAMVSQLLWTNSPLAAVFLGLVASIALTWWSITYLQGIGS